MATGYYESESQQNYHHFIQCISEQVAYISGTSCLVKINTKGTPEYQINSAGFVGDEAGGLWFGLREALNGGSSLNNHEASCHQHFNMRTDTKAKKLPSPYSN